MQRKDSGRSPLLKVILSGDSSLSINMPKMLLRGEEPMFRNRFLNNCVIFKYPNFELPTNNPGIDNVFGSEMEEHEFYKPVDTAIYIPNDHRDLELGGSAIYLRQRDFDTLMNEVFGIKSDSDIEDMQNDIKMLRVIDQVPSLDPYLLRTELTNAGFKMPDTAFRTSEKEDEKIRRRIESKIEPILYRALESAGSDTNLTLAQKQRFLNVLWNPDLPEAEIFIKSFGIERSQTGAIFTAWKGITFYQIQFESIAGYLRKVFSFLKGRNLVPLDKRLYSGTDIELLNAKTAKVISQLRDAVEKCRKIFTAYDAAYTYFVDQNDAGHFKRFLMSAHENYWVLGFSLSACKNAFEHIQKYTSLDKPLSLRFDTILKMLDEVSIMFGRGDGKQGIDNQLEWT
ncbi:MAG: hypothetical protein QUV20_13685 [Oceanibaculum nanhaiense]|uniref:hypothetical protein n=1 Tax=Oceanibaculum nanhaiense TaxID=1909734 RepID=UPI0025A40FB4|nr:hypothetical protein [Oceanibaculum nanhaiense]MDM7947375.1 hypothetical protein [Oceanibaculum nanhaiense]